MADSTNVPIYLKSELDLFHDVPVQLGIDSSSFLEIYPLSSSQSSPLEFVISANDNYLDLSHSILHIQVKITKKDGSDLVAADDVAPINYFLNTMFGECSVFLNDKQVASQTNYEWHALLETLLFSPKATHECMYRAGLFYKDTHTHHDVHTKSGNNSGYNSRHNLCKLSKVLDLIGPLHFDLATQPKLLINGVNVRIKLDRNKDIFSLMASEDSFKVSMQSACLFVRKVHVAPSIMIAHEKALENGVAKYPLRRIEVKTYALSSGLQSSTISNAFIGQLPTRIILGLVSNQAFNGHITRNPFKFNHYNLNYLAVLNGGVMIPTKPFQPNFEKSLYARSYLSLFTDLNRYHNHQNINISYDAYIGGYSLWALDLTADYASNAAHTSVTKNGNLAIDLKFASPLSETVSLVIYAEYRNVIEIDKSRSVFADF